MAAQTWPPGIPVSPLWGSYSDKIDSFVGEFTPDVGPPSRWPRSSKSMLEASWRVKLDAEQRLALVAFYDTSCKGGALPFTLADPQTGAAYDWFWVSAPGINSLAGKAAFSADIRVRRFL